MRKPCQVLVIPFFLSKNNEIKYVLFHKKNKFWQFISGGVESTDCNIFATVIREIYEETGINANNKIIQLDSICSIPSNVFGNKKNKLWENKYVIPEYSFAYELQLDFEIILSNEHDNYLICDFESAYKLLYFDSNKTALYELHEKILNKKIIDSKVKLINNIPIKNYSATNYFMDLAIDEAREGIYNVHGGPFGCVIVKNNEIVGAGHNKVVKYNDPSAHGEIDAIRDAGNNLGTFDLTGCVLYTTGEPCAMCLSACLWANIERIYYGCSLMDNSSLGFRDSKIDLSFIGRKKIEDYLIQLDRDACQKLFEEYLKIDKVDY